MIAAKRKAAGPRQAQSRYEQLGRDLTAAEEAYAAAEAEFQAARGELEDYHLAHAARADLCRRLGRTAEARASYQRALSLAQQAPERRFLERRLASLPD